MTVLALTVFMLVFGGGLVQRLLALVPPAERPRWEGVLAKSYGAVGGYLGGVLFICSINATLTTTVLALIGTQYFLPLGLLSGFSSLVPYAGPILTGGLITLVTLITGGAVKALITLGYFLLYGQLEGNVLGPFIFRRTVHLDPLITLLGVLFLAELLGIAGALVAVPAVALAQIVLRELLAARRERHSAEVAAIRRHRQRACDAPAGRGAGASVRASDRAREAPVLALGGGVLAGTEQSLDARRLHADREHLLAGVGDLSGRSALHPLHQPRPRPGDLAPGLAGELREVQREVRGVEERLLPDLLSPVERHHHVRTGYAPGVHPEMMPGARPGR